MFGLIIFIVVLSFIGRLFSRPYYGYFRPRIYPFGRFGGWGTGYYCHHRHHHPMHFGYPHRHYHMGYGPMRHRRMW